MYNHYRSAVDIGSNQINESNDTSAPDDTNELQGNSSEAHADEEHMTPVHGSSEGGQSTANFDVRDDKAAFKDVMQQMNTSRLNQVAVKLRIDRSQKASSRPLSLEEMLDVSYTHFTYVYGSYNLAYRIQWKDGTSWFVRIPGHGTRFGQLDIQKMNSEYQTMRYVRSHTTIPLPEVIFWTTSPDLAGVPFAIISGAEGGSLCLAWDEMPEDRRLSTLSEIAGYMAQLHKLSFDMRGMLTFDSAGDVSGVGPYIALKGNDLQDVVRGGLEMTHWRETTTYGPYDSVMAAFDEDIAAQARPGSERDACLSILKTALETMPPRLIEDKCFYLTKPDSNWQNIYVNEAGKVTSFIDWDMVGTETSVIGYARTPIFLCADWNPVNYEYDPGTDDNEEMSPEQLVGYRTHYSGAFTDAMRHCESYDPRMTNLAHVVWAIDQAIGDRYGQQCVVAKLMEIAKVPFELDHHCRDFEKGEEGAKNAIIRNAFAEAWKKGWDVPEGLGCDGTFEETAEEDGGSSESVCLSGSYDQLSDVDGLQGS
ncbi:uncharacterized protein HMPREF1541_00519 [Cyphellophora europaea CBS 101466]|uniref:Aminoglycoside phosphotransferase domain-containing protein n=1 Tax=Cyphellophora europaea (strain CBS 101466) TaxID=1220924 RepID=W2SCI7_CYPE1|nr:uncharacterized protein HMPREF1541_00519 [Cyphellophora europaea CBS 101466]ETN46335.1 hypothetical protein HMPREF1541_00519 [Cyphellophora europaea CBS 101466]